jgi:hypothetical protein
MGPCSLMDEEEEETAEEEMKTLFCRVSNSARELLSQTLKQKIRRNY